ncbi:energy transducer TonB [Flavobacterium okayamense]|uniref:TonB C-terminal domain-containing protein n=1 Tax=Flavobacterium okayamense TaxID=2830782 RepID=A0ABN6HXT3_9FLAO|nr:energy transducer TonB [Flavobacterium okayamense]BCY28225.1 hypothetical protein KK2020170_10930 [Flavobacterium okayamense]
MTFRVLLFLLFTNLGFSQIGGSDEVYLGGDFIDPTFNYGGLKEFYSYFYDNFDTSKVEKEGQIIVSFTIDVDGKMKNIRIVQDLGSPSVIETIRVFKKAPNWEPAKRGGKPVSVSLKVPFTFEFKK